MALDQLRERENAGQAPNPWNYPRSATGHRLVATQPLAARSAPAPSQVTIMILVHEAGVP